MPVLKSSAAAAVLALLWLAPLSAQANKPGANAPTTTAATTTAATNDLKPGEIDGGTPAYIKPETPEQRMQRLGTTEDPGPDPDPKKVWTRFDREYHIEKFTRKWEAYDRVAEGWVRPLAQVNAGFELYQRNAKYIWMWVPEASTSARAAAEHNEKPTYTPEQIKNLEKFRTEFSELTPPDSSKTIHFVESSQGLPDGGSWRNSLAIADMNGDGCPDIVAPPQRGVATGAPSIFLGDCKGHWHIWREVTFPRGIDYGGVAVADFNHDGHMDLAFSVHLTGVVAWLGDGKGHFRDSSEGLLVDSFPTRKLIAADLDGDGWTDLLVISEGASARGTTPGPKVCAFINQKKGTAWKLVPAVAGDQDFAGDTLAIGNFNGDRYPDFVGGSIFYQASKLLWVSEGPQKWRAAKTEGAIIDSFSSHHGVTTAHFSSKRLDDAVLAYARQYPDYDSRVAAPPAIKEISGLDRVSFTGPLPKRTPIVRFAGSRPIMGVGSGDFDGDGNPDLIYAGWSPKREFVILLGDGKGGFARAHLEGIKAEPQTNYDLTIADVNKDGRPDVIVAYETDKQGALGFQNGSIHVFLNEGTGEGGGKKK